MKATLKPKRLDGPEDQQWSMLFKSITREEPHHSLYATQVLHGCRQLMSQDFRLIPLINETPPASCL